MILDKMCIHDKMQSRNHAATCTDNNDAIVDTRNSSNYFPGIARMHEMTLSTGTRIVIVRCPFSQDFATQTEASTTFDTAVDDEIREVFGTHILMVDNEGIATRNEFVRS